MKPCDECVKEDYDKLYHLVHYIANDYVELSYEKVRIQRDDYIRLAKRLLKSLNEK
jgi:hypothetical protein